MSEVSSRFIPADWHTVTPRIVVRNAEQMDMPYGDRRCMVEDQWGNTWQIATYFGRRGAQ